MRKVKSEVLKACGELMNEMAFMPDEIDDTVGITDNIIESVNVVKNGIRIVKEHYEADGSRKN